ncbi:class I adenylate-forming enzyme family protein [Streptosporangium saharense]|uniref:class I adenylate-forming enzyme family protein n=1 Tax=Streptosporangium saharense TaxID=1706840 RepID=UPI003328E663
MNDIITGIMETARREPYRTALIDGRGRKITYGELAHRVEAVRVAMTATAAGQGVLFAVRPGVDAVVLALGSVAAGGTLVLADPGLAPDVLAARMAATRPGWVVAESVLYTLSGPLRGLARRRGLLLPNLRDPLPGHAVRHLHTGPWLPGVPRGALSLSRVLRGAAPGSRANSRSESLTREQTGNQPGGRAEDRGENQPGERAGDRTELWDTTTAGGRPEGRTGEQAGNQDETRPSRASSPNKRPQPNQSDMSGATAPDISEISPDQPAAVIFTSGTTARPRGVVHTRRSLAAGLDLFREAFPLGPGDVVHTDQLMLGLPALLAGATWSLPGGGDLAEELAARKATHTFAVPVHLDRLLRGTPKLPATLRYLLLGAAPAPAGVLRRAVGSGPRVLSVYAMTEALPIAIASAEEKLAYPGGDLMGAPLPGVGVRIADDGELFVSGPHLAQRYLGEEPLAEIATGDLARIDDGRLVLLGRKKDMILRDGVNIYPGLYEPAITALPGVAEAAVVGLADPETGDEEVVLAVVPAEGYDETLLRKALPEIMDAPAIPNRIETIDAFPRSGRADKLDRTALRELVTRRT